MKTPSEQIDIFTYPRAAGYTEGTTSKDAADKLGVIERTGHVNLSDNGKPSHVYRLTRP